MSDLPKRLELHLNSQGSLELPISLWRSLGFELGDTLIVHLESGRIVLEKQETIKRRLKTRFSHLPQEKSLADELIEERREATIDRQLYT